MNLPLSIAWRYLFSRKSHNVINVISLVSAIGMALGTAALVLIMSVYNGFNSIIDSNLSDFDPDVKICAADGGYAVPDSLVRIIGADSRVCRVSRSLEFETFLTYGDAQGAAHLLGTDGDMSIVRGDLNLAAVGASLASDMGINPKFVDPVVIYAPDRERKISLLDPMASMRTAEVYPERVFSVNPAVDASTVVVTLSTARHLFGKDNACSSVDVRLCDNSDRAVRRFKRDVSGKVGDTYVLMDKYEQHPDVYRMMRLEKAAVYLILLFVVLIVALNIFGSLSMLIVEKKEDMDTLKALGADTGLINRIFVFEGWLVSLAGMGVGLVAGVLTAFLQQQFGLVKMPGNYIVQAYPVVLHPADVLLAAVSVGVIGFVISLAACSNIKETQQ
ncbi:MAG: FtsX-like permease family protein [Bacteroidales bacterium]|nr:FtsX-like permease family protein [Bacteroidales bacterium]